VASTWVCGEKGCLRGKKEGHSEIGPAFSYGVKVMECSFSESQDRVRLVQDLIHRRTSRGITTVASARMQNQVKQSGSNLGNDK
jgi:hypothetical protein